MGGEQVSELTLTAFLLERIAEDTAVARLAQGDAPDRNAPIGTGDDPWPSHRAFAERVTPARVLAECGAKRRIVERVDVLTGGEKTYLQRLKHTDVEDAGYVIARDILIALALPYADHPDYDERWRP